MNNPIPLSVALLLALIGLGAGVVIGYIAAGDAHEHSLDKADPSAVPVAEVQQKLDAALAEQASAKARVAALEQDVATEAARAGKLEQDLETLRKSTRIDNAAELAELQTKVQTLSQELETAKAEAAEATAKVEQLAKARAAELAVAYGEWGKLQELTQTDWKGIGTSSNALINDIGGLFRRILDGETPSQSDWRALQKHNTILVKAALALEGKLPTSMPGGNGEFTHPVMVANMIASALQEAEQPLTDAQRQIFSALGEGFDRDFAALQQTWEALDAHPLQRLAQEVALKRSVNDAMFNALSAAQQRILVDPPVRHIHMLDIYSPVLMAVMSQQGVFGIDEEMLRTQVQTEVKKWMGVDDDALVRFSAEFDRYMQEVSGRTAAKSAMLAAFFHIDDFLVAAEAQIKLFDSIARGLALNDEQLTAARNRMTAVLVPKILPATARDE